MQRGVILLYFLCSELQASPLIISHRAGMGHFPQASPTAITHSISLGIQFIELDLRLTADGVPVVHHDPDIDPRLCRWSDGSIPKNKLTIASLSLTQIKQLHCGITTHPEFPDQIPVWHHILTLQDVLTFIGEQNSDVYLMLELKHVGLRKTYPFVRNVLAAIDDSGLSHRINLQSASPSIVAVIKKISLWHRIKLIEDIVAAPASLITPRRVAFLQRLGKRVVVYTINEPEQWEKLLQTGVDGFITDYPRDLKEFLARRAIDFHAAADQ